MKCNGYDSWHYISFKVKNEHQENAKIELITCILQQNGETVGFQVSLTFYAYVTIDNDNI